MTKKMYKFNSKCHVTEMTEEEILEYEKEQKEEEERIEKMQAKRFNYGVIQDTMAPILCHADGKMYDSKSEYRRALKRHGMIEVGNELKDPEKRYKKESMAEIREQDRKLNDDIDRALARFGIH
jgi:DNA-binding protein H-NS